MAKALEMRKPHEPDSHHPVPVGNTRSSECTLIAQEILSKPAEERKPLKEQEFVELRIDDWADWWQPRFAVTEWRIRWSEADRQFMYTDEQQEHWSSLQSAQNRYESRRRARVEEGFTHSDMDF